MYLLQRTPKLTSLTCCWSLQCPSRIHSTILIIFTTRRTLFLPLVRRARIDTRKVMAIVTCYQRRVSRRDGMWGLQRSHKQLIGVVRHHNCLFWVCHHNLCSLLAGKHINDPHTATLLLHSSVALTISFHLQQEASSHPFTFMKTSRSDFVVRDS